MRTVSYNMPVNLRVKFIYSINAQWFNKTYFNSLSRQNYLKESFSPTLKAYDVNLPTLYVNDH